MPGFTKDEILARGHPLWAEIDLDALRHNIRTLKAMIGDAELMGVVKGYAYGHGNPRCAEVVLEAGATRLGVARLAEALHLREAGIDAPIHVFTEPPPEAVPTMLDLDLTPTVYTEGFARAVAEASAERGRRTCVHVKVDTGMHRVGLMADEVPNAFSVLSALKELEIEGVWSHLAVADVPDHPFTQKQLDLFNDIVGKVERTGVKPRFKHIANSAATLTMPETHFDLVRCGVACYGLWPGPPLVGSADLRPVMSLRARVNMTKTVPSGDALSYGLQYELQRSSRVVTVPVGYADGYMRSLWNKADVILDGHKHRVSGVVCMDQFMVDVGSDEVNVGDVATLLGADGDERVSAEELAEHAGTINYEITSRIASRVPRLYIEGSSRG
jgi:alanine racemase